MNICPVCKGYGSVAMSVSSIEEERCPSCFGSKTVSDELLNNRKETGTDTYVGAKERNRKLGYLMGWKP